MHCMAVCMNDTKMTQAITGTAKLNTFPSPWTKSYFNSMVDNLHNLKPDYKQPKCILIIKKKKKNTNEGANCKSIQQKKKSFYKL